MFEEAVPVLKNCLKKLDDLGPFKDDIQGFETKKAQICNNIALCYK